MRRIAAGLLASAALAAAAAGDDAILVLDASGSMWGQIDGVSKVEIAREVVGGLLEDIPADRRLGLMAYGHHRRGDCGDIELVAPVGADRESIRTTVNRMNAIGMTPISEAVRRAAMELRYEEQKATVILVSDGEETCSADPCAVGAELEAAGVDFTAHIIGFDIADERARADLQCLADTTGGQFILASNAEELSAALNETVVEEPPAPEPAVVEATLTLQATELVDGPVVEQGLAWTVTRAGVGDGVHASPDGGEGVVTLTLEPGIYDVAVVRPADGLSADGRARLEDGESETLTLALNPTFTATLASEPAGAAPAGSEVQVTWTGPNREGDWIGTAAPDFNEHAYLGYSYTREGSPLSLRLPDEPGDYEIRYVLNNPTTVLARLAITATPVEASVEAPASVAGEAPFPVTWTGPNYPSDYIATAAEGSRDEEYITYSYTRDGSPLEVRAPSEPGRYEVRYVTNQTRTVLARTTIDVTANQGSVTAPAAAPAGSEVQVEWTGPNYQGDYIATTAVGAEDGAYITYSYTRDGSPLALQLPAEPGAYEIRYVLDASRTVLARTTIEATAVAASVSVPQTAPAGSTILVAWTGPAYRADYVTVTAVGAPDGEWTNYTTVRAGASPVELRLLDEPGQYEVRYVQDQGRIALARAPITTTAVTASLEAADSAAASSRLQVTWTGPAYQGDYIAIAKAGSPDSSYERYATPRSGQPAAVIDIPAEPGAYELRYVLGQSRGVLARRAITVSAP